MTFILLNWSGKESTNIRILHFNSLPDGNFFPMRPISSLPSTEPSVLLVHQISGLPVGPAEMKNKFNSHLGILV